MKKIVTLLFFLTLVFPYISYSQVNVDYNYPLKVGNEFSYIRVGTLYDSSFIKYKIIKDTVMNGKSYFVFDSYLFDTGNKILRIDTLSGRLLKPSNSNCYNYLYESLFDSLRAGLNDLVNYCNVYIGKCIDTSHLTIFGSIKSSRKFEYGFGGGSHFYYVLRCYAQQFGQHYYYYNSSDIHGSYYCKYILKGCVIDGIVYGDTSSYVGVKIISSEIPNNFSLSQNHPNPFNPVTTIKYDIPLSRGVSEGRGVLTKLIIYDILGREIETLVNEYQKPGSYEVTWDGSRYASGVYFYRLVTEEYMETKKMVLIK